MTTHPSDAMKKCKICGRHKELHHYGSSNRAADGKKCVCNECAKGSEPTEIEKSPMPRRVWDGQLYVVEPIGYQRNDGNRQIKSKGIGC